MRWHAGSDGSGGLDTPSAERTRPGIAAPALILLGSTIAWPLIQLLVFRLRFGRLPQGGFSESLVFVPMGLAAGLVAAVLYGLATTSHQRRAVLVGYAAASPIAWVGSILGGLVAAGALGPLVGGAVPLALGSFLGFWLARPR